MLIIPPGDLRRAAIPLVVAINLHHETPTVTITDDDEVSNPHFVIKSPKAWTTELRVPLCRVLLVNHVRDVLRRLWLRDSQIADQTPANCDPPLILEPCDGRIRVSVMRD